MNRVETAIRVMVRIRPPASGSVYRDEASSGVIWCSLRAFTFDHVFSADCPDAEVFDKTGTGKTYTMTGNASSLGLVQKSLHLLWKRLSNDPSIEHFTMKATYLQIYNENIRDLMKETGRDGRGEREIQIREVTKIGFQVEGLIEISVGRVEDFNEIIRVGAKNRLTKSTKMNEVSSRSHSILTVFIESRVKKDDCSSIIRVSKLSFVDLAGSQKQRQTEVQGNRLKQASGINKSLTVLSNVISKLVQPRGKNVHVPYRDSVLTKILKDSLGGNSRTVIIGTVSARAQWIAETISTLIFLQRAKKIRNPVSVNEKVEKNEDGLQEKLNLCEETIRKLEELVEHREQELVEAREKEYEAREKEREKVVEIENLKQLMLSYEKPMDFFDVINVQQPISIFSSNDSPLLQNDDSSLTTIHEQEQGTVPSSPQKNRDTRSEMQQHSKAKSMVSSIKSVYQFKGIVDGDKILRMEINFLKEQIGKYFCEDNQYAGLLGLIERNLVHFRFDQAQLQIMEVQCSRLQSLEVHLIESNTQRQALIQEIEQLKSRFKAEVRLMRGFELQKLSVCSSLQSNQQRMHGQLRELRKQQQALMQRLDRNEQRWRGEVIRVNNENIILRENWQQLQGELRQCQVQVARLNATLQQQRRGEIQLQKALKLREEEYMGLKQTKHQLQVYIEQVIFARICKLQSDLSQINGELKDRDGLIVNLGKEIQFQAVRARDSEAMVINLRDKYVQSREQVQKLKQIIVQMNSTLTVSASGQDLTVPVLVERFQAAQQALLWAKQQRQRDKKEQEEHMVELNARMEEDKLTIERQLEQLQSLREIGRRGQIFRVALQSKQNEISQLKEQMKNPQVRQVHSLLQDFDLRNTDLQMFEAQKEVIKFINGQVTALQGENRHLRGRINHYKQLYIDLREKVTQKMSIYHKEFDTLKHQCEKIKRENRKLSMQMVKLKEETIDLRMGQKHLKIQQRQREFEHNLRISQEKLSRANFFNNELKEEIKRLKEEKRQIVMQHQPLLGGQREKTNRTISRGKDVQSKYTLLDEELSRYRRSHFEKVGKYLGEIQRLRELLSSHNIKG